MKLLMLMFSILFFVLNMSAQNGTIRGKVTSADKGEELIGASVIIVGTTIGASVNIDGNYSINNMSAGNYRLASQYISFESDTIDIVVNTGKVTIADFALKSSAVAMKSVTIEAKAARSNENALLAIRKKSATVMDGISAQQISKNGDSDAAGAIKRVTGISVEGGKYVYIRGLSDRYSKTMLNGAEIPGLDPNRNSVQMDLFPTNMVDNITILKTFTPELPGSFTGGLLNIETKDFPEQYTLQFSSSLGYNTQSSLNNNFLTYKGGNTDWLGLDDGTRDIPQEAIGKVPELFVDNERLSEVTKSFNKEMNTSEENPFLNQSYSFSTGNQKNIFGKPLGFIIGLTYSKENDFYEQGTTGRYSLTGNVDEVKSLNPEILLEDAKGTENALWGAMLNVAYKISPFHKIGVHMLRNQNGISLARKQEGVIPRDAVGMHYQTRTLQYLERSLTSGQIKGEHYFEKLKALRINWLGSYTLSTQEEPDLRFFTNDYTLANGSETDTIFRIQPAMYPVPSRFYRNMEETNIDTKINFELPLKNAGSENHSKLKWGVSSVIKDRIFRESRYDYKSQGGVSYNGNISDYLSDERMNVGYPEGYLYIVNASEKRNSYTGNENVLATYLMTDIFLTSRLRMILGARAEKAQIAVISANPDLPPGNLDNLDMLPAINSSYSLTEKMNLRMAYSRTLARPNFRELAPFGSFDFVGDYFLVGNNDLQRTLIDNADLRYEFFPRASEIISLSTFYKNFINPIERAYNPIAAAANPELNYRNVNQAVLYGAELEFRKSMDFIYKGLANFTVGVNFMYVFSKVKIDSLELISIRANNAQHPGTRDMFGQSPYIINSFLNYTNDSLKFSANLSYNIAGPQLSVVVIGGAPDVYEQPRGQLDFNMSKYLGKNLSLKFSARNLLNSKYLQTQTYKGEEYVFQSYRTGSLFSLGINYLIN